MIREGAVAIREKAGVRIVSLPLRMTIDELRTELAAILAAEDGPSTNWDVVEFLSQRIYARLADYGTPPGFPREQVMNYLASFLQRRLDWRFGEAQRNWLRTYLSDDQPGRGLLPD